MKMRKKINKLGNKVLRDIPSSGLMIIGFGMILFLAIVCTNLMNSMLNANSGNDRHVAMQYMNLEHTQRVAEVYEEGTLTYVEEGTEEIQFESIYEAMKIHEMDFIINDFVYIGEGQEVQRLASVIYTFDNTFPVELQSGYVDWTPGGYNVVIGESIDSYTINKKGKKYLCLNGEYYQVTGIAKNNNSGQYDSSVYVIGGEETNNVNVSAETELADSIMFGLFTELKVYGREEKLLQKKIQAVKEEMENNHQLKVQSSKNAQEMTENEATNFLFENMNKVFMPLLLLFSIGNSYSITALWVKARRLDIAVRMTYGCTKGQIMGWIFGEMSVLMGLAAVGTAVLGSIYAKIYENGNGWLDYILYDIGLIGCAILFTLVVTTIGAYKYSKKIIPAAVLKEL